MTDKEMIRKMARDIEIMRRAQTGARGLGPIKMLILSCIPALLYRVFVTMRPEWVKLFGF